MGSIYKNATVTIAAEHAFSVREGFLKDCWLENEIRLPFLLPEKDLATVLMFRKKGSLRRATPLQLRAWAFQESRLSRRILRFGNGYLEWQCDTDQPEEALFPPHISMLRRNLGELGTVTYMKDSNEHAAWHHMAEEYSRCLLTHVSDRLPAFAGIAAELQVTWKDKYVAGMWKRCFMQDLIWAAVYPKPICRPVYLAPSWSWISLSSPVHFIDRELEESCIKIVRYSVIPEDTNASLSSIAAAFLEIKAKHLTATKCFPESLWNNVYEPELHHLPGFIQSFDFVFERYIVKDLSFVRLTARRELMQMEDASWGLILIMLADGSFQRIGCFWHHWRHDWRWEELERTIIRIL